MPGCPETCGRGSDKMSKVVDINKQLAEKIVKPDDRISPETQAKATKILEILLKTGLKVKKAEFVEKPQEKAK
jgi:hypothetical protein